MAAAAKKRLTAALAAAVLLAGCASRPLSEREIVRAAFFGQAAGESTVLLLLADPQAEAEGESFKTAQGSGATPAQALQNAAQNLAGRMFYGLMDVVGLPAAADWQTAADIGTLLYDQAKPAPELAVFLLHGDETAANAAQVYTGLRALEGNYRLHCGLQMLFAQNDSSALPVRTEQGYGFALLTKDGAPVQFTAPAAAQLAAALCGQSDRFDFAFAGGAAHCKADVDVTVQPGPTRTAVQLHLRHAELTPLTGLVADGAAADATLRAELLAAFADLCAAARQQGSDPFRLSFWTAVTYGPGTKPAPPELEILFE